MTGYLVSDRDSISGMSSLFFLRYCAQTGFEARSASVPGSLSPGNNAAGHWSWSLTSVTTVKNAWSCTFTLTRLHVVVLKHSPENGDSVFSETLVSTCESTRCCNPKEHHHPRRRENLRSHTMNNCTCIYKNNVFASDLGFFCFGSENYFLRGGGFSAITNFKCRSTFE
jgi:hypothetical protein